MTKREMPTCKKCEKQHWHFQACEEGKTFRQMGYNDIKRPTDYQRLQYRERPRLHYKDQHEGD